MGSCFDCAEDTTTKLAAPTAAISKARSGSVLAPGGPAGAAGPAGPPGGVVTAAPDEKERLMRQSDAEGFSIFTSDSWLKTTCFAALSTLVST